MQCLFSMHQMGDASQKSNQHVVIWEPAETQWFGKNHWRHREINSIYNSPENQKKRDWNISISKNSLKSSTVMAIY